MHGHATVDSQAMNEDYCRSTVCRAAALVSDFVSAPLIKGLLDTWPDLLLSLCAGYLRSTGR